MGLDINYVYFHIEGELDLDFLPHSIRARYKPQLIVQRSAPHGDPFTSKRSCHTSARYEIVSRFDFFFFGQGLVGMGRRRLEG
jgi:hypothetical protein